MEYFENTTRITKDGYAAILQMKKTASHGMPSVRNSSGDSFLERLIYNFILLCLKDRSDFHFGFLDILFIILLFLGIWFWNLPKSRFGIIFLAPKTKLT